MRMPTSQVQIQKLKKDYPDLRNDLVETYFYSILWVFPNFLQRELSDLHVKLYNNAITKITLTLAIEQIPRKHVQYLAHLAEQVDIHLAGLP